jgi:hypothetical protein
MWYTIYTSEVLKVVVLVENFASQEKSQHKKASELLKELPRELAGSFFLLGGDESRPAPA